MGTIIPIGFYFTCVGFRKVMALVFSGGAALCLGKGFKVVFNHVFCGIKSFFSFKSSTAYLEAKHQSIL